MGTTKIEWAEKVWNPVTGCTPVSEGCENCYAARMAKRFWKGRDFSDVQVHPERLDEPLHWRKPRRVFVCSMSDLFHEKVPFRFVNKMFDTIWHCQQHDFLLLTKRIERAAKYFSDSMFSKPQPNVHLGVTCENQKRTDERIPQLSQIPAAVRYVSFEPLLGPVGDIPFTSYREVDFGQHIDWVIVGGESGPGARPMDPDWVRSIRDQCQAAGVPFFMKQMGGFPNKRAKLEELPEDLRIRELPKGRD